MTPNKEDYLKTIYKLGGLEKLVSNKQIAEVLQIAPASVTEMLGKTQAGRADPVRTLQGFQSDGGGNACRHLLSKGAQALGGKFLMRHLGYSWSEAHEDAELLEHIHRSALQTVLISF